MCGKYFPQFCCLPLVRLGVACQWLTFLFEVMSWDLFLPGFSPWGLSLVFHALPRSWTSGVSFRLPSTVTPMACCQQHHFPDPGSHWPPDCSCCIFSCGSPTPRMSTGYKTSWAKCILEIWFSIQRVGKSVIKGTCINTKAFYFLSQSLSLSRFLNLLFIITLSEEKLGFFIIIMNFAIHLYIVQSLF